jgi:predicted DNA-binding transcriptional regulator YafY
MPEPQRDAGTRLDRLLAVLAWLAQHGQVSLGDLAEHFGMTPEQLVSDLELAACCGLPPYTPDRLMEIIVGEDLVEAMLGPELARPRRLSAQEGFALATAARASVAARGDSGAGDGPLERALAKLEAALGDRELLGVDLGEPAHLGSVREALANGEQLEIDYLSAWRDARSTRVVDPIQLSSYGGNWYLDALCHTAGGTRRFRVDRILGVRPTGESSQASEGGPSGGEGPFVPGPEATIVRLAISGERAWLLETVPVLDRSAMPDGRVEVTLGVVSTVWLERLLLQLGPGAEVLEPSEFRTLGREAAEQVLERYA